jgi:hypothetical protein
LAIAFQFVEACPNNVTNGDQADKLIGVDDW